MSLASGTRLGPYEILSPLGAGGMGEVYRAKDTRLDRTVAIKVLPAHLSENPELRQRFEREARAISALSHPHICTLHDVGNQDGVEFLVMECLEGESLADRLGKGPLPADQVLKFGIEIADALETAHRHGIVHRDLKPGNIMLTKSGIKLLDFGLAKHCAAAAQNEIAQLSSLPTEASPSQPLTERGTILGTFQYMSPEQLEGKEADARTDIFAFGCVLYEMATGRKAFSGSSRASLIGTIMNTEPPPISSLQPITPPPLDRVVKFCLAKDPDDRWQSAHDVGLELQGITAEEARPARAAANRRERLVWSAISVVLLALAGIAFLRPHAAASDSRSVRFTLSLPPETAAADFAISPDGKRLAFTAVGADGRARLYVRALDAIESRPVPETNGASRPFWSPDSRRIGFFAGGRLKCIDPGEGHAIDLADQGSGAMGGTWLADGRVLLGRYHGGLDQVPAGGGALAPFVAGESLRWPALLPDQRHVAFLSRSLTGPAASVDVVGIDGKGRRALFSAGSQAFAAAGYLLYGRDGALVARRFDSERLSVSGEPQIVQDPVAFLSLFGAVGASASDDVLVYKSATIPTTRAVWFDRSGKELGPVTPPGLFRHVTLTSDGRLVALERLDPHTGLGEIWVGDLSRGTLGRVASGNEWDWMPVWSPGGTRLLYSSTRTHISDLYVKGDQGSGPDKLFHAESERLAPEDWSRDGQTVIYQRMDRATSRIDFWSIPATGEPKPVPLAVDGGAKSQARLSPDERFLAYTSRDGERPETYVIPYPPTGARWQISTQGGFDAQWRSDGKVLYYLAPDRGLFAVPVTLDPAFRAGVPQPLFTTRVPDPNSILRSYAPSADGSRFLILTVTDPEWPLPINVVTGWKRGLEEMNRERF